jgi:hypothetical protein
VSLHADSNNYLALSSTWLVFQEKIVLEESKMGEYSKVNLAEMDEDDNMKNGVRVQMKQFNFEMVWEVAEEIVAVEPNSLLEN